MVDQSEDFFSSGGNTAADFKTIGNSVEGEIAKPPEKKQQRVYRRDGKMGDLAYWDDEKTQPKMQLVVTLQTNLKDDEDDNGLRNVYVRKPSNMYDAVASAMYKAKAKRLEVGAHMKVTYTGNGPDTGSGNPPKEYEVEYTPPGGGFVEPSAPSSLVRPEGMDDKTWNAIVELQKQ